LRSSGLGVERSAIPSSKLLPPSYREAQHRAKLSRFGAIGCLVGITELQCSNEGLLQQIAERNRAETALKLRTAELEQTTRQMGFISQLAELLHACIDMTEARLVVEQKLLQFFQIESGAIYLHCESSGQVERFAGWNGDTRGSKESFDPTDCWAIRLARPNVTRPGDAMTRCAHTQREADRVSICVPMGRYRGVTEDLSAKEWACPTLPTSGLEALGFNNGDEIEAAKRDVLERVRNFGHTEKFRVLSITGTGKGRKSLAVIIVRAPIAKEVVLSIVA
jgi:hypothetical protein